MTSVYGRNGVTVYNEGVIVLVNVTLSRSVVTLALRSVSVS